MAQLKIKILLNKKLALHKGFFGFKIKLTVKTQTGIGNKGYAVVSGLKIQIEKVLYIRRLVLE